MSNQLGMYGNMATVYLETNEPEVVNDLLLEGSLHSKICSLEEQALQAEHQLKETLLIQNKDEIASRQNDHLALTALYRQMDSQAQQEATQLLHELMAQLVEETKAKQPQYYGQREEQ